MRMFKQPVLSYPPELKRVESAVNKAPNQKVMGSVYALEKRKRLIESLRDSLDAYKSHHNALKTLYSEWLEHNRCHIWEMDDNGTWV